MSILRVRIFGIVATLAVAARFLWDRSPGTDAALASFPLDDAYIHLVYARSLATGHGFEYNPGQAESGFTSPLWVVVLAPGFWLKSSLGLPIVVYAKALGVVFSAITSVLAGELARRLGAGALGALAATALVALEPGLGFAQASGMEVPLANALSLASLVALHARRWGWASLLLGGCCVTRPELALLVVLFGPLVLANAAAAGSGTGRALAVGASLVAMSGPTLAWGLFCHRVTGHWLPNTFYRKHGATGLGDAFSDLGATTSALVFDTPMLGLGLGFVAFVMGLVVILRMRDEGPHRAFRLATAAAPFVLYAGLVWAHDLRQPLSYYWFRYLLPVFPLWAVITGASATAFARTVDDAAPTASRPRPSWWVRGAVVVSFLVIAGVTAIRLPGRASLFAWNCQNIAEVQVTIGRFVAQHVPPGRAVAANDAGAIRYFGHRPTLDLVGLNAHRVAHGALDAELRRMRPAVYIVFPSWFPTIARDPSFVEVFEARSPNYTICRCDQARMVVYAPRPRTRSPSVPPP